MGSRLLRTAGRAAGAGLALGATCVAWGSLVERQWYALRTETVPLLGPGAAGPLRVLHLSDLHLLPGQRKVQRFLEAAADRRPELLIATGDLVGHADVIDEATALLARLRGDAPALAVLGSNDRYGPMPFNPLRYFRPRPAVRTYGPPLDTDRLVKGLEDGGWQVIDNRRVTVPTRAGTLDVAGLGDPHIELDEPAAVDWDAPPPAGTVARIGVVHAPYLRALDVFAANGFALTFAGHTHGGQVRLPVLGALSSNCDLPTGQARGLSRHGDTWLHVSAGLGHAATAPFRFCCRPEATMLELALA